MKILEEIKTHPANSKLAMIIRHADRDKIPDGSFGNEILLNKKGIVIVSIPNVGHWSVRLSLLLGRWNYTNRGILDRTHLRFFTKKTFSELVRNSGYQPLAKFYTPVPLETILPLRNNLAWRLIDLINYLPSKIYPSLFAFQFIYVIQESNYLI